VFVHRTAHPGRGFRQGVLQRYKIAWVYFGVEKNTVELVNKELFKQRVCNNKTNKR
jgi:hypothetical protein